MEKKKITKTEKGILDTFRKLLPLLSEEERETLLKVAEGACLLKMLKSKNAFCGRSA